jgi:uncharacterized protein
MIMAEPTDLTPSPFHPGEIYFQRAIGVADRMDAFGRKVIRDYMPDQHRDFYAQLPFIVLGTVDENGATWATLLSGQPGFLSSPDSRTLSLKSVINTADPAAKGIGAGAAIGLLGIELQTRRRNRINGFVASLNADGFDVQVEHTFGNCPQYIQLRDFLSEPDLREPPIPEETIINDSLTERTRQIIASADTFFVSSFIDDEQGRHVDASHRGGKPGFVRINKDGSLTIPDFAGNLHFNTLGNLLLNPKAGLTFPVFETGDMLQMTGFADVDLESNEIDAFQGAERLWTFRPEKVVLRPRAFPLRWTSRHDGSSPNSLMTGDWKQARERLTAETLKSIWRPFRISEIVDESNVIRSFHLEPADGMGTVPHKAGQHLPIRVTPDGVGKPVMRTYTISTAPSDGAYRISVKRQGLVSNYLHDQCSVGDIIEAKAPAGAFTIDAMERRPAVLLAAGVGVTPILAMLRHIVFEGLRKRHIRPTWLFLAARNKSERAFDGEIRRLAEKGGDAVRVVRVLEDNAGAEQGKDFDHLGRIDIDLLKSELPFDGYDFFMCGPPPFMQALYDSLVILGTPDNRIHAEAFGPASLNRQPDQPASSLKRASKKSVPVTFAHSGKEARWEPGNGTLLDLAEARGLTPAFSCRSGNCGTCAVKILSGDITYAKPPPVTVSSGTALICCAVPADHGEGPTNRLILDL